jgi:MHS family proline/betaine transporter-like MFS transporter
MGRLRLRRLPGLALRLPGEHNAQPDQVAAWGWRAPFVFGLLIGPAALYIRCRLDEPEEYKRSDHTETPLAEIVASDKLRILLGAGLIADGACGSYLNTCIPTFAFMKLGLPSSSALLGTMAAEASSIP